MCKFKHSELFSFISLNSLPQVSIDFVLLWQNSITSIQHQHENFNQNTIQTHKHTLHGSPEPPNKHVRSYTCTTVTPSTYTYKHLWETGQVDLEIDKMTTHSHHSQRVHCCLSFCLKIKRDCVSFNKSPHRRETQGYRLNHSNRAKKNSYMTYGETTGSRKKSGCSRD